MKISKIYSLYQIPPNLQMHMYRVASLAKLISNSWKVQEPDTKLIVESCLLHDLGNIIKFDFENFPETLGDEQENIEVWKAVKEKMQTKYGKDEDVATTKMIEELNVNPKVKFIVNNWGFKNFKKIEASDNIEWKICVYSDHRISPDGIATLEQNLENKKKRYAFNRTNSSHLSLEADELLTSAKNIEKFISKNCSLKIKTITNADLEKTIAELKEFEVE